MREYRLTPAARHDLSSIWEFTEERWGVQRAETYLREIDAAMSRIAEDPRRGHPCDEIREGYLKYGIGSHLVFYVPRTYGVAVIRILHSRMDPTLHL